MAWTIKFTKTSQRQLKKLDRSLALRVLDYMDKRVALLDDPRSQGKNLVGPRLGSYWRYRVGDLRVICDIQDNVLTVLVVEIGRRREIYR
ncbi:MAG: type II toxin-antitoxin system RelE/ParE family toxin [Proteobacteria bacterium]|nr:type II toxin-antitoxin system RelE/ParE family toxin [Pseudomonadota bacterium]